MRCNQVSIFIERFGKYVPKDYPADVQRISVYCDDFHSIYAALSKAYATAVNELNEYESIGARTDVSTNEFLRKNLKRQAILKNIMVLMERRMLTRQSICGGRTPGVYQRGRCTGLHDA